MARLRIQYTQSDELVDVAETLAVIEKQLSEGSFCKVHVEGEQRLYNGRFIAQVFESRPKPKDETNG